MDLTTFLLFGGDGSGRVSNRTASRLRISGDYFVTADGQLFTWKGLTAFLLHKLFLTDRKTDALRYMDWAASLSINVLRVFTQVDWDGIPASSGGKGGVAPGYLAKDFPREVYDAALHDLLMEAAARGQYVEAVAHTFRYGIDAMRAHSHLVDDVTFAHDNGLFEDANEPPVNGIPIAELVAGFTPRTLASSGQYDPSPWPGRQWVNDHPPRDDEFARKFKGSIEYQRGDGPYAPFSPKWVGPVVLDEPKRIEEGGSDDDWRAFGAGTKFFCAGGTVHGGAWAQTCTVPTDGGTLGRIHSYLDGMDAVPTQRYHGYEHVDDRGSLRRYRRQGEDGHTYEISVRPYAFTQV